MTISVVLPVYNEWPADVAEHLQMLRAQKPDEIIVVDDGSDIPVEVPADVKLIRQPQNFGVPFTLNAGLARITTTHVLFSAVGDKIRAGYFDSIRRCAALSHRALDETYTARAVFTRPDGFTHKSNDWGFRPAAASPWYYYDKRFIKQADARGALQLISHATVFASANLNWFCTRAKWHCDWLATHEVAYTRGIVFSPQIAVEIKTSPDSYSGRGMDDFNAQLDVIYNLYLNTTHEMRAAGALGAFGWPALWFYLFNNPRAINKPFLRKAGRRIAERLAWKYAPRWLLEKLKR